MCDMIDYDKLGIRRGIPRNNFRRRAMRMSLEDFRRLPFRPDITEKESSPKRLHYDRSDVPPQNVGSESWSELVDCLLEITARMD